MYKVSVIVPVYNAQSTIATAIDSVINQTLGFDDIELILVDDASTDNTGKIIEDYADKYDNIRAIFLDENTGSPSKPRNIGIGNVTGEYLMFLDNDDELTLDACEMLYNTSKDYDADIVHCRNYSKFINGIFRSKSSPEEIEEVNERLKLRNTMWGNIFKTSMIKNNNIRCPDSLYEDGVFAVKAYTCADKVIKVPYYGYIYTVESESDSITHDIKLKTICEFIRGYEILNSYCDEKGLDKEWLFNSIIPMLWFMFFKLSQNRDVKIKVLRKIRQFEKTLGYNVHLGRMPLNYLNGLLLKEKYSLVLAASFFARRVYKSDFLRHSVFKSYSDLEKVELDNNVR